MDDERGLEPTMPADLDALAGAINAEHWRRKALLK